MTEQSGIDSRQRGFFWGRNELIKHWAPLIGLDGIGLLATYDVWCDRRQSSTTRGYAFPSRRQEEQFYGIPREELAVITSILQAVGLLRVETRQRPTGRGRGDGGTLFTTKNLYELVDRDWALTFDDVVAVLELADRDKRVFKRIRHVFRPEFAPIDERGGNPWAALLPQLAQHPLWQKLAAREREQAARTRQRFEKPDDEAPAPNRRQLPVATGSDHPENRWQLTDATGKPVEPMATDSCRKHDAEEEEEEEEGIQEIDAFHLFASLASHADYRSSLRDLNALVSLRSDGYTLAEIAAGVERAVASALERGTTPKQFTYCVPAIRDVPPASLHAKKPAPATEQAATPEAAAPPVAPLSSPAAVPGPFDEACQQLREFAYQRGLDLSPETLGDLARLALDFDAAAARQGSTGLIWVKEALKRVNSKVESTGRYVCAILRDWQKRGCDALPRPALPAPAAADVDVSLVGEPGPAHPAEQSSELAKRWEQVLEQLQLEMTRATFDTWLRYTRLIDFRPGDDESLWIVQASNPQAQDWLSNRLYPLIQRALAGFCPGNVRVEFVVASQ